MFGIAKDSRLMGEYRASKLMLTVYAVIISIVFTCVAALIWFTVSG